MVHPTSGEGIRVARAPTVKRREGGVVIPRFFSRSRKSMDRWELGWGYLARSPQNLDTQGFAGKILRNKELADWAWFARTSSIVRFLYSG